MGDEFIAKIEDLTKGNNSEITVRCDYCNNIYVLKYCTYNKRHDKEKDCCGNPNCTDKKTQDVMYKKYGVKSCSQIESVVEKRKQTNLLRYGVENPFSNEKIKEKIKNTNLEKYGNECASKTKEIREKMSNSMKEFYIKNSDKKLIKEKSPMWIGDADYKRQQRATFEYNFWRKLVFERDDYTCQKCKIKRTHSWQPSLNAHHILNFSSNESLRTDINNGITLCEDCHMQFHRIYGKKDNSLDQLNEFLNNLDK